MPPTNPNNVAHEPGTYIWQDRDIRFDTPPKNLVCRVGEYIIDSINSVEDTKGNNGERGSIICTNLRLIWVSHKSPKTNLSIGLNTVISINIRNAKSKLRGPTQALYIMTKFVVNRFEFVFTSLVKNSPRLFTTVQSVLRAYESSKLYRDLKLRGSIIRDNSLMLLPLESVYNKVDDTWNLSSDQGNLGCFYVTNVRLVWHANLAQNFNVSVPYMQIKAIKVRDSKFGKALVIETQPKCGGYMLGFRVHPAEKLEEVFREITALFGMFSRNPIFGVDFQEETEAPSIEALTVARIDDDVEIVDADSNDAFAAYFAEGHNNADEGERGIEFDEEIGLACEGLPDGFTMSHLWQVVSD
jgi:Bardet-Biedl syndrome 5 protein